MDIPQFCRYEVYGKDESGNTVTVHLSDDVQLDAGNNTQHYMPISIDLSDRDMSLYTDLTVAVWYSKSNLYPKESGSTYLYQYLELSEAQAQSMAIYNSETGVFTNARGNGLLIYDSADGKKYYYVSALYDNERYSDTSGTYGYKLYNEYKKD